MNQLNHNFIFWVALIIGIAIFFSVISISFSAPNFRVERDIIPEANNTYEFGSSTNPTRVWLGGYFKNASTSVFSVHDRIYIGGTATSTIYGTASSTFLSGIELDALYAIRGLRIGGTATTTILGSATSTFPSGILISGGGIDLDLLSCDSLDTDANGAIICGTDAGTSLVPNLIYRTLGVTKYYTASTSATDNLAWHFNNGFVSSASSTIAGTLGLAGQLTFQGVGTDITTNSNENLVFSPAGTGLVGLSTTTPNDNATSSTAGVFYAGGAFRNQMCNLTDAATIFVDGNCGNRFRTQMAGNRIIEFHHFYEGQTGILTLQQDVTGSRIPTKWIAVNPTGTRRGVVWRGGATTTLSTAANRIDKIGFEMGTDTLFMIASSTNFTPIDY